MTPEQEQELAFEQQYAQEQQDAAFAQRYAQEQADALKGRSTQDLAVRQKQIPKLADYAKALSAGATKGVIGGLGGLPVDTAANVIDLGKAGAGYLASKLNNGQVPAWAELTDRTKVPGSSQWILNKMANSPVASSIQNPIQNLPEGRALENAGSFAGQAAFAPARSLGQTLGRAIAAAPVGATSGAVAESTGDPALGALTALGMGYTPTALSNAGRYALRGGNQNARQVNQNIQDFANVGITPSLGQATQNTPHAGTWQGIENLLSGLPGGLNKIREFREKQNTALQNLAENAGGVGSSPGTVGGNIQQGLAGKVADVRQVSKDINANLEAHGGSDTRVAVPATEAMLQRMSQQAPTDPAINALLQIPHTKQIQQAIADTTAAVQSSQVMVPTGVLDAQGNPGYIAQQVPGRPAQGVALSSLRPLQQQLGEDAFANFTVTPPSNVRQQRQLYGALGEDMSKGLEATDPAAAQQLRRSKALNTALLGSNSATNPVRGRLETIEPMLPTNMVPERAFAVMESKIMGQNPNLTDFNAIKKSLPADTRAQFASTIVNRLGRAGNAKQDETGGAFSPETFLTNYAKLTPDARDALFSGFSGAMELRKQADNVAKVVANMREGSKIYGNPSGTANRGGAMGIYAGLLGGLGSSAVSGNPLPLLGALSIPASISAGSSALLNPAIARYAGTPKAIANNFGTLSRVAAEANKQSGQ